VTGYGIAGVTIGVVAFAVVGWLVWTAVRIVALEVRDRPRPRPPLVDDPADRRAAAVAAAYVAGKFGYDELEWRILLALVPPPPDRDAQTRNWELAQKAAQERMMEPVDVSGFVAGRVVVASPTHSKPWSAAPATDSVPWSAAPPHCRYHELHSGSGYIGTVCDCGHDMAMHYDGGCADCDAAHRRVAPPKPIDAARSVRPATRQSHG
jgi:hypothetical protein